ncbi:hypothetical protein ACI7BZ_03155 [Xanthobacter sp. AM11]|uniref:hypothetical protein n=1 Tax=Xanthobacter sp. AM11 TaxID=3380643 RepID=UPI0039BF6C97
MSCDWAADQRGNKHKLHSGDALRDGEHLLQQRCDGMRMITDAAPPAPTFTDAYGRVRATGQKGDNGQGAYEARLRDAWR